MFIEDIKYLESYAKILRTLLSPKFEDSLEKAFSQCHSDDFSEAEFLSEGTFISFDNETTDEQQSHQAFLCWLNLLFKDNMESSSLIEMPFELRKAISHQIWTCTHYAERINEHAASYFSFCCCYASF